MTFTLVRRFLVGGAILALASVNASATSCNATLDSLIDAAKITLHVRLLGDALPPVSQHHCRPLTGNTSS